MYSRCWELIKGDQVLMTGTGAHAECDFESSDCKLSRRSCSRMLLKLKCWNKALTPSGIHEEIMYTNVGNDVPGQIWDVTTVGLA